MITRPVRSVVLMSLLALLASAVSFALTPVQTSAQASHGVELRLAAHGNDDGSVSVGLQYRLGANDNWRPVQPTRNLLPATAETDRWHVTNAAEIEVAQAQVEIGVLNRAWSDQAGPDQFTVAVDDTRFRARCGYLHLELSDDGLTMQSGAPDCEHSVVFGERQLSNPTGVGAMPLRIAARRVADGVEVGIQRLVQGRWEALRQPNDPLFRALPQGQWRFSSEFGLPAPPAAVFGQLRRGATITTRDGEFVLDVDGRIYRTPCGRLYLRILTERILVDTFDKDCHESAPLLTICPTSDCDEQQNAAYAWESRQIGATLDTIELTLPQARGVVNALFADYFPRSTPPTVSFSDNQSHGHGSQREIVLGTNTRVLGATVHELAHALVGRAGERAAGHNGAFTAMLLDLWERYFPIADISAARDDARRSGIEIASQPPARAVSDRALETLNDLLCGRRPVSEQLCQSFVGAMPQAAGGSVDGHYVGYGWRGENLLWQAYVYQGRLASSIDLESRETNDGHSVAELGVGCHSYHTDGSERLYVVVRWRSKPTLTSVVSYRFGDSEWRASQWETGTWGENNWNMHHAPDASHWLRVMSWHAHTGQTFEVNYRGQSRNLTATFDLAGIFDTPVQPHLTTCGSDSIVDPDAPVIDWGRFGDDFFWGVDQDEDPLQSYVVSDSTINGSNREARLSVQCQNGRLEIDLHWDADQDLDWTVQYRINANQWQSGEWYSGWSSWNDIEYKWTGLKQAENLVAQLAWAAQSGGTFTAEVHERDNANRRYTATWPLDGLFETPIQPNLARCGR